MYLSAREQACLGQLLGLLAEGLDARELRIRLGQGLLGLLRADHFASYVWDPRAGRFTEGVYLNMDPTNLARYEAWFQFRDPITAKLQACRHATRVCEVMPYAELRRTEFFNDFLARDGLHSGINLHAFSGTHALGDLRIWRGRQREDFGDHERGLLNLLEPALIAALKRGAAGDGPAVAAPDVGPAPGAPARKPAAAPRVAAHTTPPSAREAQVATLLAQGLTDKEMARHLAVAPSTVRTYLNRLYDKTGTQRRAALVAALARQSGAGKA